METPSTPPSHPSQEPSGQTNAERYDTDEKDRDSWRGKVGPAFWSVASLISLAINIFLVVVVLLLVRDLFDIKRLVQDQVIGGLYENFVKMDEAHIATTITVSDTIQVKDAIPVVFDLPLKQNTAVVLTQDTPIRRATIYLNNTPVPLDLVLRQGTRLYIALDMVVPVSQMVPIELTVPVSLQVPVDIALSQTELHEPFTGLQGVLRPYKNLLDELPDSWYDTVLCNPLTNWWCRIVFGPE
jgi:hypothetical protein